MKWFKHYANAHTNQMIQYIIEEHGLDNAMRYWLLLELLCGEFREDTTIFQFSSKQLKNALHIKFDKKLTKFAQLLTESSATFDRKSLNFYQTSENFWKIETPIILELMGKDFKRSRQRRGSDTPKNKEERRKKKKYIYSRDLCAEKKEEYTHTSCAFDFEAVYQKYPLKKGKSRGMKIIQRQIKKPDDFERFSKAVDNYANEVKNTEPRYIKHFSTFVSEWTDWVDHKSNSVVDRALEFLGQGEIHD